MKIIFFDGVCNLCNRTVSLIIKHDRKKIFKFASIQSGIYSETFPTQNNNLSNSIVFLDEDEKFERSDAFLKILSYLFPKFNILIRLLFLIPEFLRDAVYNWIAKYRYKLFGKMDTCRIPDESITDRFLQ